MRPFNINIYGALWVHCGNVRGASPASEQISLCCLKLHAGLPGMDCSPIQLQVVALLIDLVKHERMKLRPVGQRQSTTFRGMKILDCPAKTGAPHTVVGQLEVRHLS